MLCSCKPLIDDEFSNTKTFRFDEKPTVDDIDRDSNINYDIKYLMKCVLNMLFYVEAFPIKIKPGVPPDYKKTIGSNSNYVKTASIQIDESLILNKSKSNPHFRIGHFRRLTHERYINKKGQLVFVNSCMVNGKAKTVVK